MYGADSSKLDAFNIDTMKAPSELFIDLVLSSAFDSGFMGVLLLHDEVEYTCAR